MRNNLHDELIADYAGITAAIGHYRAAWFLRFLGLEDYPTYRPGGRLVCIAAIPRCRMGGWAETAWAVQPSKPGCPAQRPPHRH